MSSTDATTRRSDDGGISTPKRLLVGADSSDAAGAACSFALWLAGKAGARIVLLHACAELELAAHAAHTAHPELLIAAAEQRLAETGEWQRRLQNLADYAADATLVESRVVRARPAAALLDAAAELESDLVLVGSTGVGSIRGRLLGSVSSQVVDHAPCSMMVLARTSRARRRMSGVSLSESTAHRARRSRWR